MLKTYEAIYDNEKIVFLSDKPKIKKSKVFLTVLDEEKKNAPILKFCGGLSDKSATEIMSAVKADCGNVLPADWK